MREGTESGRRGDERREGEWEEGGRREIEQWPEQSAEYKAEVFVTQAQEEQ